MEGFMVMQHISQINNEIVADGFGKQLDSSRGEIVILPNILATECWDIDGDIRGRITLWRFQRLRKKETTKDVCLRLVACKLDRLSTPLLVDEPLSKVWRKGNR